MLEFYLSEHTWSLLDEGQILDTFAPLRARTPNGTTDVLADRDARFFHMDVVQSVSDTLSPFRFNSSQPDENRIFIDNYENIAQFGVHTSDAGLNSRRTLKLIIEGNQGSNPLEISFTDYESAPSNVLLNGQPTSAWLYDAVFERVTLQANSPGPQGGYKEWMILP